MMLSVTDKAPSRWKLAKLKDHPRQADLFGDVSEEELKALAKDMKKHGQRHPVEVLPDGTIVAGHQRVKAARLLGWADVKVVVLDDLVKEGEAAVEARLISDNLVRRHLSPLGKARCIKRLMEIDCGKRTKREEIKAEIGRRLGMSARNVNRYLLALEAPSAVQQAFDRGEINLITAGKMALLDKVARKEVERRLAGGEPAALVVADRLMRSKAACDQPDAALTRLLRSLRRDIPRIAGKVADLNWRRFRSNLKVLEEARAVLAEVCVVTFGPSRRA